jgi:hypothetical protein
MQRDSLSSDSRSQHSQSEDEAEVATETPEQREAKLAEKRRLKEERKKKMEEDKKMKRKQKKEEKLKG